MKSCLLFIIGMVLAQPAFTHDIHVSVCDVDLRNGEAEVVIKTFLDDLQLAVGLVPGSELPEDYTSAEDYIIRYVQQCIKIIIDDRHVELVPDDISASMEAVWITLRFKEKVNKPQSIQVNSTFLTEVYDDQTNLVNIFWKEDRQSYALNHKKKLATYQVSPE